MQINFFWIHVLTEFTPSDVPGLEKSGLGWSGF